jgi:hypothetical protein
MLVNSEEDHITTFFSILNKPSTCFSFLFARKGYRVQGFTGFRRKQKSITCIQMGFFQKRNRLHTIPPLQVLIFD